MHSPSKEGEKNPYAPYAIEKEWWEAEEKRIREEIGQSYLIASDLRSGGKDRILHELITKMIERGDESVMDFLDILTGSERYVPKKPHPLTQKEEDDLRKNVTMEFGPPKFG
jgi:hypothetical protein